MCMQSTDCTTTLCVRQAWQNKIHRQVQNFLSRAWNISTEDKTQWTRRQKSVGMRVSHSRPQLGGRKFTRTLAKVSHSFQCSCPRKFTRIWWQKERTKEWRGVFQDRSFVKVRLNSLSSTRREPLQWIALLPQCNSYKRSHFLNSQLDSWQSPCSEVPLVMPLLNRLEQLPLESALRME